MPTDVDFKTDFTVYRPGSGDWYNDSYYRGATITRWGLAGDVDVAADFDGDGKADIAVWRPSSGIWFVQRSAGGASVRVWGGASDNAVGRLPGS